MEGLPKGYFKYNEDTLISVRKSIGMDKPGAMEDAVNILEDWVKMQGHFNKTDFERRYLETTLIVCKGSIEKAKSRLDRGCTLRTLMPQLFGQHDIRHLCKTQLNGIEMTILSKLTKDNIRVSIVKVKDDYDILSCGHFVTYAAEYLRRNDYAETNCLIIDYEKTDLVNSVKRLTMQINTCQQIASYLLECCGFRMKSLYAISSSKFIETVVSVFKQLVTAKLRDRIHVLKDRKTLKNLLDAEVLPKEYGGTEKSLQEIRDKFIDELSSEEHSQYMKEINSARTDESRRQSAKFNEEYLGMPGSFRKLDVD